MPSTSDTIRVWGQKKTVVEASRSRRDRARERDAPTTNLQLEMLPKILCILAAKKLA